MQIATKEKLRGDRNEMHTSSHVKIEMKILALVLKNGMQLKLALKEVKLRRCQHRPIYTH